MACNLVALASTFGHKPAAMPVTLPAAAVTWAEVAPSQVLPVRPMPARKVTPALTASA